MNPSSETYLNGILNSLLFNQSPPFLTIFFPLKSRQQCFSDASTRRPADLLSSFSTIKTVMNNLYDGLAEVMLILLKSTDTRERVLEYLAEVININASRAHIQVTFFLIGKIDCVQLVGSYFVSFFVCIPCHYIHAKVYNFLTCTCSFVASPFFFTIYDRNLIFFLWKTG